MQEHIEWLKERYKMLMEYKDGTALEIGDCIEHAELMLSKEKEVIINAYVEANIQEGIVHKNKEYAEYYYDDLYGE